MHHLTCKQVAKSLEISESKATQASDPTFRKMALLISDWPGETLAELAHWVAAVAEERKRKASAPPMTDAEIAWLERAREGRFNTTNGKAVRACR